MMQKDQNKEFDQIIRSMLENAQEEVPSRVWESVSAGLDRRRRVVMWKRWTAGVAAAAAVFAAVVLLRNNSTLPYIENGDAFAVVQTAPETPDTDVMESPEEQGDMLASAVVDLKDVKMPARVHEVSPAKVFETPVTAESEETAAEEVAPEVNVPATKSSGDRVNEKKAEGSGFTGTANDAWSDPFAFQEEPKKKNPVQLQLGGDLLGNGSPSSTASLARRYASSFTLTETTVSQTSKESTYSIPVSLGLGVRIPLSGRWSIGTGLEYSRLERTFTGTYTEVQGGAVVRNINTDIHNVLHYIGVPVYLYADMLKGEKINFYSYAGGTVEKALCNKYSLTYSGEDISYSTSVNGVQLSAAIGFGVEFKFAPSFGLYLDPSLRYYFDCNQPVSIRTQQPFTVGFEVGLRLGL